MSARIRIAALLLFLAAIPVAVAGCGSPPSQGADSSGELSLRVTLTKSPLDRYVSDSATAQRLYTAAVALPLVPAGAVFHCPADDGRVYHLSFIGGTVAERQMTANASGCRFLTVGNDSQARMMDNKFVALFTHTLGITSLDPYFPQLTDVAADKIPPSL